MLGSTDRHINQLNGPVGRDQRHQQCRVVAEQPQPIPCHKILDVNYIRVAANASKLGADSCATCSTKNSQEVAAAARMQQHQHHQQQQQRAPRQLFQLNQFTSSALFASGSFNCYNHYRADEAEQEQFVCGCRGQSSQSGGGGALCYHNTHQQFARGGGGGNCRLKSDNQQQQHELHPKQKQHQQLWRQPHKSRQLNSISEEEINEGTLRGSPSSDNSGKNIVFEQQQVANIAFIADETVGPVERGSPVAGTSMQSGRGWWWRLNQQQQLRAAERCRTTLERLKLELEQERRLLNVLRWSRCACCDHWLHCWQRHRRKQPPLSYQASKRSPAVLSSVSHKSNGDRPSRPRHLQRLPQQQAMSGSSSSSRTAGVPLAASSLLCRREQELPRVDEARARAARSKSASQQVAFQRHQQAQQQQQHHKPVKQEERYLITAENSASELASTCSKASSSSSTFFNCGSAGAICFSRGAGDYQNKNNRSFSPPPTLAQTSSASAPTVAKRGKTRRKRTKHISSNDGGNEHDADGDEDEEGGANGEENNNDNSRPAEKLFFTSQQLTTTTRGYQHNSNLAQSARLPLTRTAITPRASISTSARSHDHRAVFFPFQNHVAPGGDLTTGQTTSHSQQVQSAAPAKIAAPTVATRQQPPGGLAADCSQRRLSGDTTRFLPIGSPSAHQHHHSYERQHHQQRLQSQSGLSQHLSLTCARQVPQAFVPRRFSQPALGARDQFALARRALGGAGVGMSNLQQRLFQQHCLSPRLADKRPLFRGSGGNVDKQAGLLALPNHSQEGDIDHHQHSDNNNNHNKHGLQQPQRAPSKECSPRPATMGAQQQRQQQQSPQTQASTSIGQPNNKEHQQHHAALATDRGNVSGGNRNKCSNNNCYNGSHGGNSDANNTHGCASNLHPLEVLNQRARMNISIYDPLPGQQQRLQHQQQEHQGAEHERLRDSFPLELRKPILAPVNGGKSRQPRASGASVGGELPIAADEPTATLASPTEQEENILVVTIEANGSESRPLRIDSKWSLLELVEIVRRELVQLNKLDSSRQAPECSGVDDTLCGQRQQQPAGEPLRSLYQEAHSLALLFLEHLTPNSALELDEHRLARSDSNRQQSQPQSREQAVAGAKATGASEFQGCRRPRDDNISSTHFPQQARQQQQLDDPTAMSSADQTRMVAGLNSSGGNMFCRRATNMKHTSGHHVDCKASSVASTVKSRDNLNSQQAGASCRRSRPWGALCELGVESSSCLASWRQHKGEARECSLAVPKARPESESVEKVKAKSVPIAIGEQADEPIATQTSNGSPGEPTSTINTVAAASINTVARQQQQDRWRQQSHGCLCKTCHRADFSSAPAHHFQPQQQLQQLERQKRHRAIGLHAAAGHALGGCCYTSDCCSADANWRSGRDAASHIVSKVPAAVVVEREAPAAGYNYMAASDASSSNSDKRARVTFASVAAGAIGAAAREQQLAGRQRELLEQPEQLKSPAQRRASLAAASSSRLGFGELVAHHIDYSATDMTTMEAAAACYDDQAAETARATTVENSSSRQIAVNQRGTKQFEQQQSANNSSSRSSSSSSQVELRAHKLRRVEGQEIAEQQAESKVGCQEQRADESRELTGREKAQLSSLSSWSPLQQAQSERAEEAMSEASKPARGVSENNTVAGGGGGKARSSANSAANNSRSNPSDNNNNNTSSTNKTSRQAGTGQTSSSNVSKAVGGEQQQQQQSAKTQAVTKTRASYAKTLQANSNREPAANAQQHSNGAGRPVSTQASSQASIQAVSSQASASQAAAGEEQQHPLRSQSRQDGHSAGKSAASSSSILKQPSGQLGQGELKLGGRQQQRQLGAAGKATSSNIGGQQQREPSGSSESCASMQQQQQVTNRAARTANSQPARQGGGGQGTPIGRQLASSAECDANCALGPARRAQQPADGVGALAATVAAAVAGGEPAGRADPKSSARLAGWSKTTTAAAGQTTVVAAGADAPPFSSQASGPSAATAQTQAGQATLQKSLASGKGRSRAASAGIGAQGDRVDESGSGGSGEQPQQIQQQQEKQATSGCRPAVSAARLAADGGGGGQGAGKETQASSTATTQSGGSDADGRLATAGKLGAYETERNEAVVVDAVAVASGSASSTATATATARSAAAASSSQAATTTGKPEDGDDDDENKREEEKATTIKCITNCQTSEGRSQASLLSQQQQQHRQQLQQQQVNSSNGNFNNNSGASSSNSRDSKQSERNRNNSDISVTLTQQRRSSPSPTPAAPSSALAVANPSSADIITTFDKNNNKFANDNKNKDHSINKGDRKQPESSTDQQSKLEQTPADAVNVAQREEQLNMSHRKKAQLNQTTSNQQPQSSSLPTSESEGNKNNDDTGSRVCEISRTSSISTTTSTINRNNNINKNSSNSSSNNSITSKSVGKGGSAYCNSNPSTPQMSDSLAAEMTSGSSSIGGGGGKNSPQQEATSNTSAASDTNAASNSSSPVSNNEATNATRTSTADDSGNSNHTDDTSMSVAVQDDNRSETKQRVPSQTPADNRSILILREIESNSAESEVRNIFNSKNCPSKPVHCEYALHNSWYVTFKNYEEATSALAYIRKYIIMWEGQPIMARIKPKPAAPSVVSNQIPPSTVPPLVMQATPENGVSPAVVVNSAAAGGGVATGSVMIGNGPSGAVVLGPSSHLNPVAAGSAGGAHQSASAGASHQPTGPIAYQQPNHHHPSMIHMGHMVPHPHAHHHHHHHSVPGPHNYGYSAVAYYNGQHGSILTPWHYSNAPPPYDLGEVFIYNGLVPYGQQQMSAKTNSSMKQQGNNKISSGSENAGPVGVASATLLGGEQMAYHHHHHHHQHPVHLNSSNNIYATAAAAAAITTAATTSASSSSRNNGAVSNKSYGHQRNSNNKQSSCFVGSSNGAAANNQISNNHLNNNQTIPSGHLSSSTASSTSLAANNGGGAKRTRNNQGGSGGGSNRNSSNSNDVSSSYKSGVVSRPTKC